MCFTIDEYGWTYQRIGLYTSLPNWSKILNQLSKISEGGKEGVILIARLTSFKLYRKVCEIDILLSRDGLS